MTDKKADKKQPPKILKYLDGFEQGDRFDLELSIQGSGQVILFHSHGFKEPIGWFEFDTKTRELAFFMDDGDRLDIGLPLYEAVSAHMHNAHQILMVQMNPETGDTVRGQYYPLILSAA